MTDEELNKRLDEMHDKLKAIHVKVVITWALACITTGILITSGCK